MKILRCIILNNKEFKQHLIRANLFLGYSCDCKLGFVGDGYSCRRPRGDEETETTMSPNNNRPGNSDNNGNENSSNRVPEPTCVFSVCSCPPGWALHVDNVNNKRCIEAPQPQGKLHPKII